MWARKQSGLCTYSQNRQQPGVGATSVATEVIWSPGVLTAGVCV